MLLKFAVLTRAQLYRSVWVHLGTGLGLTITKLNLAHDSSDKAPGLHQLASIDKVHDGVELSLPYDYLFLYRSLGRQSPH